MGQLRRHRFLADAPPELLAALAARAHWRSYAADELIIGFGDSTHEVFFVLAGCVRVVVRSALGQEAVLNEMGPGEIFGELAAIDGRQRSASVTALFPTTLGVIPGEAFLTLVMSSPVLTRRLLGQLAARLRVEDERLFQSRVLPVRQRLIAELLRLARGRGAGELVVTPPPTQEVLAARIGARRESVSRALTELARAGLLTVGRQGIVLPAPETLRAELASLL